MSMENNNKKHHILFVDDHVQTCHIGKTFLEKCGFDVLVAHEGKSAIEIFNDNCIDLLILDVLMPGMNGYEVCRRIREFESGIHVPILIMTGLDDLESIQESYEAGATDFTTKPVNWTLLGHRINYIIRASRAMKNLSSAYTQLTESENRLSHAQQIACLGHWRYDTRKSMFTLSSSVKERFSLECKTKEISLTQFLEYIHIDDREQVKYSFLEALDNSKPWSSEHRFVNEKGEQFFVEEQAEITHVNNSLSVMGTIQDISDRKSAEDKIKYLASYDPLTDLPNRSFFKERFSEQIEFAKRYHFSMAILSLDLDNFKRVNDTLGHNIGDSFLKKIAVRISDCIRSSDVLATERHDELSSNSTVARFGGDEFTLLLPCINSEIEAAKVAKRVLDDLIEPIKLDGHDVYITASIGISLYPNDGDTIDTLLKNADAAMYHSKDNGKNTYQFYNEKMNSRAIENLTIESELRKAIQNDELEVHYQAKYDLTTNKIVGFELLSRWFHKERGSVPPIQFIPIAEDIGLIIPLGYSVLEMACKKLLELNAIDPELSVAVNLSALQFKDLSIVTKIHELIIKYNVNPNNLELEITESMLMDNLDEVKTKLHSLNDIGIQISIDDFGTGYSSLSYLKEFPIASVKIDKSFVDDITTCSDDEAITNAIIAMSHSLNMKVIAEGVEEVEQLELLRKKNCEEIQGYYISRPIPFEEIADLLSKYNGIK